MKKIYKKPLLIFIKSENVIRVSNVGTDIQDDNDQCEPFPKWWLEQ